MDLKSLLVQKKSGIVKKWFNKVAETYHPETQKFLKQRSNRFANPVGSTLTIEMEAIFDALHDQAKQDKIAACLDKIIKIRAVQDFSPSEALQFIFSLKQVIREELNEEIQDEQISKEMLALDSQIDNLGLLAFDVYMSCRETIYRIKENEYRRNRDMVLTGTDLKGVTLAEEPELGKNKPKSLT
ncbi:MAG: RsbRD N-terminal domain-containing protein [Deltaproteobacteria bacterium]|nr:RsbRD N-terminal domain-containing protein [Deltaproteobacteria bacterium]